MLKKLYNKYSDPQKEGMEKDATFGNGIKAEDACLMKKANCFKLTSMKFKRPLGIKNICKPAEKETLK